MVAIYTLRYSSTWAVEARDELLANGVPALLIGPEFHSAAIVNRLPYVIIDPCAKEVARNFRRCVSYEKIIDVSEGASPSLAILSVFCHDFGTLLEQYSARRVRFCGDLVYFRGNPIPFTKRERLIITLLLMGDGLFFAPDEIAASCLERGAEEAVAVHVCHINKKIRRDTRRSLIETRRYWGYRIV